MPILVSYCFSILILGMQECFQRICHNNTIALAKLLCNIYIGRIMYMDYIWREIYSFYFITYATMPVVISQKAV